MIGQRSILSGSVATPASAASFMTAVHNTSSASRVAEAKGN
jgi:hypothetical protein